MAGVQDVHAALFACRLAGAGLARDVENINVVAVARKIDQVGPFLPHPADRQRLAEVEIALEVSLHRLDFMHAPVIGRHVGPRLDNHRPAQAWRAELVLPVHLPCLRDQGHHRVLRRRDHQKQLRRCWAGGQTHGQRRRVDPDARHPADLAGALVEAIKDAAHQGENDPLVFARIAGKATHGR